MSPIRSRRWTPPGRRGWAAAIGITAALGVLVASLAFAVHEEDFQMDGNVQAADKTTNYPNLGDVLGPGFDGPYDWDSLFTAGGVVAASLPDGFLDARFVKDFRTKTQRGATVFDTSDGTTYTTGSKDILPISGWRCVGANNATDKGDIMNAYATAYVNGDDRILYFALEKYVDNGNNNVGFWFLADGGVGCPENQTGNGTAFSGAHSDGDLLIVSEFTNGGGVSSIKAYRWNGGANGSLGAQPVEVGVDCVRGDQTFQNIDICATTNVLPIDVPWLSASKTGGLNGEYPSATFFEGAINLKGTEFEDACFNTFLANTRSSQETTATLYDWALGDLSTCGTVKVTKVTGPDTTDAQDFGYTVTESVASSLAAFTLDTDPASATPGNTITFENVPPGDYTIDEGAVGGWYLDELVCTRNGVDFDQSAGETTSTATGVAAFTMGFGDLIECTYTNLKPDAAIDVTGDGTNRVDDDHEFTATTWADPGDGSGMALIGGVDVTFALTDANGADTSGATLTCTTEADDADPDFGSCSITIDSLTTGTTTGTASATITVGGVQISVDSSTDAKTEGAESVLKKWVDAAIDITGDGTNRVGDDHDFVVTTYAEGSGAGATMAKVGGVSVTVTLIDDNGADSGGNQTCTTSSVAGASFGTCSVTFDSDTTGTTTGTASATITVEGEPVPVSTTIDAKTEGAEDALKKWVDAAIDITGDGTNHVGVDHDFVVTTYAQDSSDGSTMAKVGGVEVTVTLADANGAASGGNQTCTTEDDVADADFGTCTVTFDSDTTGTTTGTASATITVEGLGVPVTTTDDAQTEGAENALKTWVDAWLDIEGDGTNRVGSDHDFVVTAYLDAGDGNGRVKAGGVNVSVTLADANGAASGGDQQCTTEDDVADADFGTCTVTFDSDTTGTTTGSASATITVVGEDLPVTTAANATVAANQSVLKTWIDARIGIVGTGTNGIGEPHTFTITIEKDLGTNGGWVAVAASEVSELDVTLDDADGASHVLDTVATTCPVSGDSHTGTGTDGSGQCVVVFTSNSAGTVTGSASAKVTIDGVPMPVATGDSTSQSDETVVKTFVAGSVAWIKHDHNGNLLPGATFEVCRTKVLDTSTEPDSLVDEADPDATCVTVLDNDALDADPADGKLKLVGLVLGQYTVEETIPPAGYSIKTPPGPGPHNFPAMTLLVPDVTLAAPFVNEKLFRILVLTCDDGTDALVDGTVRLGIEDKQTILPAEFLALGWKNAAGEPLTQQDLCNLGFASFGGLEEGTYDIKVEVPDRSPFFDPL